MASTKLKRTLALALAGGSLAIGVPAALAATGGDSTGTTGSSAPSFIQDEAQPQQQRPDREDCPEKGGAQDGAGEGGSADQGGATGAPSV